MSNHEMLVKKAKGAIAAIMADCTVDVDQTCESLQELREDIDVRLSALAAESGGER